MPDPMLLGAAIFATGALAGRFMPARRRGPKPPKKVEPYCGCKNGNGGFHHLSYHDPGTGACHGRVYTGMGIYENCTCRQYSGPQALPEYFAPEVTDG